MAEIDYNVNVNIDVIGILAIGLFIIILLDD